MSPREIPVSRAEDSGDEPVCDICLSPLLPDDLCSSDYDLGIVHAACGEGSTPVDLDTGEPLPEGGTIATFRYGDHP